MSKIIDIPNKLPNIFLLIRIVTLTDVKGLICAIS